MFENSSERIVLIQNLSADGSFDTTKSNRVIKTVVNSEKINGKMSLIKNTCFLRRVNVEKCKNGQLVR